MDPSSNGAYGRTQNVPSGRALEARTSVESQRQRLQKQRSNLGVRNASQPLPAVRPYGQRASGPEEGAEQAKRGSLRNVVRRIFGRRSKVVDPQTLPKTSPPRHAYHYSEPSALLTQVEEPEPDSILPHRTLSAPLQQLPSPSLQRVRSPYAVNFPHSSRLKPLPLGDPYYAPGSQLRRRKSLPSLVVADEEADEIAPPVDDEEVTSFEEPREKPATDLLKRASTIRSRKRRSRSADDLRQAMTENSLPRKRSDEIRFWRDSSHFSVLRASGFVSKEPRDPSLDIPAEDRTPVAMTEDPFTTTTRQSRTATLRSSPHSPQVQHERTFSDADIQSASGYGTELSKDLEDRVARLEAGLQNFQQSLARLTAERNRRTVLVGGMPQKRRLSTDARTPSMLADTLSNPFALASLQYDLQEPERPSTSPQPPRTPVRATGSRPPPVPPLPFVERMAEPFSTPPPPPQTAFMAATSTQRPRGNTTGATGTAVPPTNSNLNPNTNLNPNPHRAHRPPPIETQLNTMRHEINDLHYQVSVGSGVQSHRSSVHNAPVAGAGVDEGYGGGGGGVGAAGTGTGTTTLGSATAKTAGFGSVGESRRLREMGTAFSTATTASTRDSGTGGLPGAVVSRFSGSESEGGTAPATGLATGTGSGSATANATATGDARSGAEAGGAGRASAKDLMAEYDAYRTPLAERRGFHFGDGDEDEEGRFYPVPGRGARAGGEHGHEHGHEHEHEHGGEGGMF
ncbi:hypothetical protein LTR91_020790 [Friedmanniomyces endolithicus]|uniref:Uncharacterized protein n=1 Tax=Friedmanniomyces endolithicus TaxID=329885 RepID=A0AAN6K044_9PEZI|nr:hypothetical protein LTR57_016047 [Friedmanniomyces endolithicus]KAK0959553.1 hypothetical protein LTR91_020790 [Friedmanniomyces endolithicus]KAK0982802.1 hypothetical protein LTS01_011254 [Friedmanniomyces endolithicus]KAK1035831.1 hypothetical protein LTS16_014234 [Friedmanniomyces endolithicus]